VTSTSGTFGSALTLTASGGSGTGVVTYVVTNGTAVGCSITAGVLTATRAGTCVVTATRAADTNYNEESSTATTVTFAKAAQSALTVASTSGTVGSALTLTSSGGSGTGAVTYTVTNGTAVGCSITAGVLTATQAGTCLVTATRAADSNYNAESSTATAVTMNAAPNVAPKFMTSKTTVTFAANSATLSSSSKTALVRLFNGAKARGELSRINIKAYVYSKTMTATGKKLAINRAKAVARYLTSLGARVSIMATTLAAASADARTGRRAETQITHTVE
jgi:outer membrane protein OmpA-like peptidoglycan-associated protein